MMPYFLFFFFGGGFWHSSVNDCSKARCDFGALTGGDERLSFYSAIVKPKPVSSCGRNTNAKCVGWVQLKLINPKVSGWTLTIHLILQDWPWSQKKRWWPSLRGLISKSYILLRVGWECTREQGGALFSLILLTFWVSGGGFCNVIVRSRFASTKPSFRCKGAKHKIPLDSAVCSNQLCGREQPAWTIPSPGLSPPGGM